MKDKLKKGYIVSITTWENDGDNYNTVIKHYNTKEEIDAIVKLAELFDRSSEISNMYDPNEDEEQSYNDAINLFVSEHPSIGTPDAVRDLMYDLGLCSNEFFTRVTEKIEVIHIKEDVIAEDISKSYGL